MIRRFNRYELKYMVTSRQRDAMLPVMLSYMSADREASADGVYEVSSLYYDTIDLACFRAKLDGTNYRRKLRIRRYGALPPGANPIVMVEIKQRINRTTQKRRIAVPLDEAYALCDGSSEHVFADPLDRSVAEEVMFLAGAQQLGPKCLISYRRRPLVGSAFEPGLRITFDEDLTVAGASAGVADGAPKHRFLPADRLILEVKTNDVVPLWVSRLLAAHSCTVIRFSKYCTGIAHLRGLPAGSRLFGSGSWTS